MPPTWTTEQILALAPDVSSMESSKDLADPDLWQTLGCNDTAAWGEYQGSAKAPYQVQIELSKPTFKCSCPSRKFPCKHGLGLFLLLANYPDEFKQKEPPPWVTDWLASQARRRGRRRPQPVGADVPARPERVVDPKARAKRAMQREARVAAGLQELELYLCDLVRNGLAAVQSQPYSFWEAHARRLVDAQAPSVARELRKIAKIPSSGAGWPGRLLERLSRLYLLIEAFKRIETLPPDMQADIRTAIGWTQNQNELMTAAGVRDRWLVLGQSVEEEDRLRVQRTWLWGRESKRPALVLHFAPIEQPVPDTGLVAGTCLDAELVFFPSAYPLRALVKERHAAPAPIDALPGFPTIAAATAAYAAALARNPWLERFPMPLQSVVLMRDGEGWSLYDSEGRTLSLVQRLQNGWLLLALSGGHPIDVCGEWDGDHFRLLGAMVEGRFVVP
ncbi:MAG: SWIM zinc finger family protein [Abditibacteriales bacterium]|nr:SWIM zinc finger family protein [Abditibacteriales bacterium]MDW8364786.1 SWIM zinc finger family protein [Abditibacteriales bacterium]